MPLKLNGLITRSIDEPITWRRKTAEARLRVNDSAAALSKARASAEALGADLADGKGNAQLREALATIREAEDRLAEAEIALRGCEKRLADAEAAESAAETLRKWTACKAMMGTRRAALKRMDRALAELADAFRESNELGEKIRQTLPIRVADDATQQMHGAPFINRLMLAIGQRLGVAFRTRHGLSELGWASLPSLEAHGADQHDWHMRPFDDNNPKEAA